MLGALFSLALADSKSVGTWTSTNALADSTIDPLAMMISAKGLPTSHYVDYSVVFN